jgi:aryl-alcohol dehydrogenase-like predicted oxidoreductase
MRYRVLGKTGLKISEIGMGTWQLANDPSCWVGADLKESLKTLYKYTELGGNFIDTAWVYGYKDSEPEKHPSEELIGKFLKESGRRDKVVIATKVAPKNWKWPALHGVPISEVFPNEWIIKSIDDSLKSLGVDCIDLVHFHVWQDDFAKEDGWKKTIQALTKQGKVKYWGLSLNDYQPSNCFRTLETGLISTVQCVFNIFHQKPKEKLFPFVKKHHIGLITRVPLDEGGLTGKFTVDTKWPKGDFRNIYFQGKRLPELVRRTDALKTLLNGEAKTMQELALRLILSHDAVSTAIPGMRKVAYVESNTAISDGRKLTLSLLKELQNHSWERNFYWGHDPYLKSSNFIEA